jgi:hypothetical protein
MSYIYDISSLRVKVPETEFEAVQRLVSNMEIVMSNEMGGWLLK